MKKNTLILILNAVLLLPALAQTDQAEVAQELLNQMAELYELTADQQSQMARIQSRKMSSLQQIASLATTAPDQYRAKKRAIYSGTRQSVRLLLTEAQQQILKERTKALRLRKATEVQRLKAAGASPAQIEEAIDAIEASAF